MGGEDRSVEATTGIERLAVRPLDTLNAGETSANATNHVAVHRYPARHACACRTVRHCLEKSVRSACEQLERHALLAQFDQHVVERIYDKPLRACTAVICGDACLHSKSSKLVERQQIVLGASAKEKHRFGGRVCGDQAFGQKMERCHAISATYKQCRTATSYWEPVTERPHYVDRIANRRWR